MGKMNIKISDELEDRFRKKVGKIMGSKKGNIMIAIEEAIEKWVKET